MGASIKLLDGSGDIDGHDPEYFDPRWVWAMVFALDVIAVGCGVSGERKRQKRVDVDAVKWADFHRRARAAQIERRTAMAGAVSRSPPRDALNGTSSA